MHLPTAFAQDVVKRILYAPDLMILTQCINTKCYVMNVKESVTVSDVLLKMASLSSPL